MEYDPRRGPSKRDPYAAHDEGKIALETLERIRLEEEKALKEELRGKVVRIDAVVPFRRKKPQRLHVVVKKKP